MAYTDRFKPEALDVTGRPEGLPFYEQDPTGKIYLDSLGVERRPAVQAGLEALREQALQATADGIRRYTGIRHFSVGGEAYGSGQDKLTLTHWSDITDLTTLDPSKHGTGLTDAASQRKAAFPDLWVDRTYFGLEGYEPEVGLGSKVYTTRVDPKELYDIAGDPDVLRPSAIAGVHPRALTSKYEIAIKKAGYTGYWVEHDGKRMAAVFKPLKVNPVISAAKSIARRLILRR